MRRSFYSVLGAITALLLYGSADASNINISLEDAHREEIEQAFTHLKSGRPEQAEQDLSRVIAAYESAYAGENVRCAQDQKDAIQVGLFGIVGTPEEIARHAKGMKPGESKVIEDKIGDLTVLGPGWCQAVFGRGFALIDLHRGDEAEPLLAWAVKMAPTRAHYLNEYAELFKSRREWQRSYDLFARAAEVAKSGPDSTDKSVEARALRGMGFTKIELGELDEAEQLFKRSLSLQPNNAGALSELEYIARKKSIGAGT